MNQQPVLCPITRKSLEREAAQLRAQLTSPIGAGRRSSSAIRLQRIARRLTGTTTPAGLRYRGRNAASRTVISITELQSGRYTVTCETHRTVVVRESLTAARQAAKRPCWCADCERRMATTQTDFRVG